MTLQPPPATSGAARLAAPAASSTPASSTAASSTSATVQDEDTSPRTGLVFQSWREGGKGAAVLAFHWASGQLLFEFDEPFPDAYNPHPDDTPERRRVGGRLANYVEG